MQSHNYIPGMITAFCSAKTYWNGPMMDGLMSTESFRGIMKYGLYIIILQGPQPHAAGEILRKTDARLRPSIHFSSIRILCKYRAIIKQAQAMNLSLIYNTCYGLQCPASALVNTMKLLLNYAVTSSLEYANKYVYTRKRCIVEDTTSPKYPLARMQQPPSDI